MSTPFSNNHGRSLRHTLFSRQADLLSDESGQSLVLIALFGAVFMFMLGLVLDVGLGMAVQKRMQTAADVAALAGAKVIAQQRTQEAAGAQVEQLLEANGASISDSDYTFTATQVEVNAQTIHKTLFLPFFGINDLSIGASATATWGALQSAGQLMPFTIEVSEWAPRQTVALDLGDERTGPGNFGWLQWAGQQPSTQTLMNNIDNPQTSEMLSVGDLVTGAPGNKINSTLVLQALQGHVGETLMVPLYRAEQVSEQGNNLTYVVQGFAQFQLTYVDTAHDLIGITFSSSLLAESLEVGNSSGIQSIALTR